MDGSASLPMKDTAQYFTQTWIAYYTAETARFFYHTDIDADDASQDAQEKLMMRLQSVTRSDFNDAYVRTAFRNILKDLYRHHFGRVRPPVWVNRLGAVWVRIFELFCLQRLPVADIHASLPALAEAGSGKSMSLEHVEQAVQQLRNEQACPKRRPQQVSLHGQNDDNDTAMDLPDQEHEPVNRLLQSELASLLRGLFDVDANDSGGHALVTLTDKVRTHWHDIIGELTISDDERLMLRLVYQENESINAAARILGVPAHQVRRPLARVLERIRDTFQKYGLELEDFNA